MLSYDDAYVECIKRIRACPITTVRCWRCAECDKFEESRFKSRDNMCIDKQEIYVLNDSVLDPVRIYEESINEELKITTKKALRKNLEKSTDAKKKAPLEYIFLTINPRPKVSWEKFSRKVFKTVQSNMFADYTMTFEQRGTIEQNDLGRGFHAHILFKRHLPLDDGLTPSNIKRNLKQSWKAYSDTTNHSCFNIQFIGADFAQDKLDYIEGYKTGDGKDLKCQGDIVWREKMGIDAVYRKT